MLTGIVEWLHARDPLAPPLADFSRNLWKQAADVEPALRLGSDGTPDRTASENVQLAYMTVMSPRCGAGLSTPERRLHYLRDAIRPAGRSVNPAHLFLAEILRAQDEAHGPDGQPGWRGAPFCRTIFTTNFDPLLQTSLQLAKKLYVMSDRPESLSPPDDDESHEAIHLIYTHGTIFRNVVLNSEREITLNRDRNASKLVEYLSGHGVIAVGYGGWDDALLKALLECRQFARNLYWCGVFPADEADGRLGADVRVLLGRPNAFYVPIPGGADRLMQKLHARLCRTPVPSLVAHPLQHLITSLDGIRIPEPPAPAAPLPASAGSPADDEAHVRPSPSDSKDLASLQQILGNQVQQLRRFARLLETPAAVPHAVDPGLPPGVSDAVGEAQVAKVMGDAQIAFARGDKRGAVDLWTVVIGNSRASSADRAAALDKRAVAFGLQGDVERELRDYAAGIAIANVPPEVRAKLFYDRGLTRSSRRDLEGAIEDFTASIGTPGALPAMKGWALNDRALARREQGDREGALGDLLQALELPELPDELRATALNNRAVLWEQMGRIKEAEEDWSAVLGFASASPHARAQARLNRGLLRKKKQRDGEARADWTAVMEMDQAPAELREVARRHLEMLPPGSR